MESVGLLRVRAKVAAAAVDAGRSVDDVTLVAVSKGRSDEAIGEAVNGGQTVFGENRQQGLLQRVDSEFIAGIGTSIEWHFIGPLQRRKARFVNERVALLHSMDRMSLGEQWGKVGDTPVLIQFNLAGEPQKSGFAPAEADEAMDSLLGMGVAVRGVMAIPPQASDAELTRPHFAELRRIFERYGDRYANMDYCSMGMSGDYEVAIAEGATIVRIGRAIFETAET